MLTIRPTTADDVNHVVTLEGAAETAEWLGETGALWHEKALADPDQEHVIAEYDGALVGFAVLAGRRTGNGVIELRRMVVDSALRGSGHGRALLQVVVARAHQRHGAHRVWLDVKVHNRRARSLYKSEGFVPTETQFGAITDPDGTTSDLLVMVRQLSRLFNQSLSPERR